MYIIIVVRNKYTYIYTWRSTFVLTIGDLLSIHDKVTRLASHLLHKVPSLRSKKEPVWSLCSMNAFRAEARRQCSTWAPVLPPAPSPCPGLACPSGPARSHGASLARGQPGPSAPPPPWRPGTPAEAAGEAGQPARPGMGISV